MKLKLINHVFRFNAVNQAGLKILFVFFLYFFSLSNMFGQHLPAFSWAGKDSVITLYSQLDYPIEIKLNNADPALLQLKAKGATIIKMADTSYQIRFLAPEEEVKIKLYYKNLPVDIMTARVTNPEMPNIVFKGVSGINIARADLSKLKSFEVVFPALMDKIPGLEFYTCKLSIIEPGKPTPFFINLRSPDLPAQLQGIITNLPVDSYLVFEELKIKTRSNNVMNMDGQPVKFRVVE